MAKYIRTLSNSGDLETSYWTGSSFSSNIELAETYTSGRKLQSSLNKAKEFLNRNLSVSGKTKRVIALDAKTSSQEASFVSSFNNERSRNSLSSQSPSTNTNDLIGGPDNDVAINRRNP